MMATTAATGPRFDSKIETIKVIKSKISLETVVETRPNEQGDVM